VVQRTFVVQDVFLVCTTNVRKRGYNLHLIKFGGIHQSKTLSGGTTACQDKRIHSHILLNVQLQAEVDNAMSRGQHEFSEEY
jgi:hypothetical protein